MCSMGGGSPDPKPLTPEEMKEMTDNPFKNPNSGVSAPSWKPEEVEEEIAAQEAAREKLKITDTAEVTPRASSSGGMGAVERNKRAAQLKRGYSRGNPTKAQRAAKARRSKK